MAVTQQIIFGLVSGSYIAIAAIGFSMVFGILNIINFAYGAYLTFGAYLGFILMDQVQLGLLPTVVLTIVVISIVGLLLSLIFFRPIKDRGPIPILLVSVGLGMFLRNAIRLVYGPQIFHFEYSRPTVYRFDYLGGFFINSQQLTVIFAALMSFVVLHIFLTRTKAGVALRAMADNDNLAQISGVNLLRYRNYVWLISSGLGGLAGVLLGFQRGVSPELGFSQILIILTASILGGIGSVYGAFAASYILAITIALSVGMLPTWATELGNTMAFLILIVILLIRPSGLTGGEVREV